MEGNQKVVDKIQEAVNKIQSSTFLQAMMQGMMGSLPATVLGSFATLLGSISIPAYQSFIQSTGIAELLNLAVICTNNIIALIICAGMAGAYAKKRGLDNEWGVGFAALVGFLVLTPFTSVTNDYGTVEYSIPMQWLGAQGMFSAIVVATLTAYIFDFAAKHNWTVKMPDSVPSMISDSFSAMIPGAVAGAAFLAVRSLFAATPFATFHGFIYGILQAPLTGLTGNIFTLIIVSILTGLLWFFGIHGAMVTLGSIAPVLMTLDMENIAAVAAGNPAPNALGFAFYSIASMGGGYIGLQICLMLFCKSERYKALSKVSAVPAFFGISEPLIFGAPLVMNPKFMIPFVFAQPITLIIGYVLNAIGLLPNLPGINPPSGTPFLVKGFMAGGLPYLLFELAMLVLLTIIWMPFVRKADAEALAEEQQGGQAA